MVLICQHTFVLALYIDSVAHEVASINDTMQLYNFIKHRDNKIPVYPILLTVSGLPKSGKTTSLNDTFFPYGQQEGTFSHHELVVSGFKRKRKFQRRVVYRYEGFKEGIMSGIICHNYQTAFDTNFDHNSTLPDTEMNNYMHQVGCFLLERQIAHKNAKESEFLKALDGGIGLVNVWDMAVEQTNIRSLLECFNVLFTQNYMWLFVNLERDYEKLHLPPEDVSPEMKSEQWRPRIQYLLRTCLMSKRLKSEENTMCRIFATYTPEFAKKNCLDSCIAKLKRECKNAARQMGVRNLINFEIVQVDLTKPQKSLKCSIKLICMQEKRKHEIPISWLFLRGSFADRETFYISYEELQEKALVCKIPLAGPDGLEEFCEFFTSFGSIIDVRQIDPKSPYIIVKPFEFLNAYNSLCLRSRKGKKPDIVQVHEYNSPDEAVVMEILASVSLAIKLPAIEGYFVPMFRVGSNVTRCNPNAVQLTLGIGSPRVNMQVEMLKKLMFSGDKNLTAGLDFTGTSESKNLVSIRTIDSLHRVVNVQLISQGNIMEISFSGENKQTKEAIEIRCLKIVKVVQNIIQMKSELFNFNLQYQFAVRCEKDQFDSTVAFNAHRIRHPLPNRNICEDCVKKGKEHLQMINAWNKALKHVRY